MAKVIIIGDGRIGAELRRQLERDGHLVVGQVTRKWVEVLGERIPADGMFEFEAICRLLGLALGLADVGMIAIPNANRGQDELRYIRLLNDSGLHIVTCAKAAHAYEYPQVLKFGTIGNSACVGGGTDMLNTLWRRQLQNENVILDAVVNGTLNSVWAGVQGGASPIGAISDAKALGYAEPGSSDNFKIINGELDDIAMKAATLYNVVFSDGKEFITPDQFKINYFRDEEDIHRLSRRNARRRLILTFASVPDYDKEYERRPEGDFGSLAAKCGRWSISGNFFNVAAESHWFDWLREAGGVMNGWRIYPRSKDGPYSFVGPGAGPETTAAAMVRDLNRLLAAR